jgi:hypothetical protein
MPYTFSMLLFLSLFLSPSLSFITLLLIFSPLLTLTS